MAKYTEDEIKALGAKGHAFKNADGHYSFPIDDEEDLHNAIHAVGRGGADHDAIRKYIIGRAKAMGLSSAIPDNWTAGGGSTSADRSALDLRRRRRGSMVRKAERRGMLLEMRAKPDGTGGTSFVFEGYGATFDDPFEMWDPWGDPYTEVVKPGAFTRSLGARPDVPFLIGHNDQGIPLARTRNGTMQLSQDTRGLLVLAQMDGSRSDVRNLASAVERGDLDEMSIGFVTMGQEWSQDYETRSMLDLELHRGDVSAVALAANPGTAGASMTAFPVESLSRRAAANTVAMSLSPDHAVLTTTHDHQHAGPDGQHSHPHTHTDDNGHDHAHPEVRPEGQTAHHHHDQEHRASDDAAGEVSNTNDGPDYNTGAAAGALCVNGDCSAPGRAKTCGQCGGPLYGQDGTIVLDDSGVVEEVGGPMADADLLSRRLRLLELA